MRFSVEAWAPDYGAVVDEAALDAEPTASVECSIEIPERSWAPHRPDLAVPLNLAFVDGVSRVDAQLWIENGDGDLKPGLCATYAAGICRCDGRATVGGVEIRRGLFTPSGAAGAITTRHATYELRPSTGDVQELGIAVVERMRALEADVARTISGADLIVLDGLLWGRSDIPHAIGYVKSHRAPYLPAELNRIVASLEAGERTPLFLVTTAWTRFSWYLRLPGGVGHPWSGVVRCEASPDLSPTEAGELADTATVVLPRFASASHKDPRAPQNLYPIAGLERELRRRSGDAQVLYRGLLSAARSFAS